MTRAIRRSIACKDVLHGSSVSFHRKPLNDDVAQAEIVLAAPQETSAAATNESNLLKNPSQSLTSPVEFPA